MIFELRALFVSYHFLKQHYNMITQQNILYKPLQVVYMLLIIGFGVLSSCTVRKSLEAQVHSKAAKYPNPSKVTQVKGVTCHYDSFVLAKAGTTTKVVVAVKPVVPVVNLRYADVTTTTTSANYSCSSSTANLIPLYILYGRLKVYS